MARTVCLIAMSFLLLACDANTARTDADYVIQNVRLFDGEDVYANATIVIDDGVVQTIYIGELTDFAGDNVIDGAGSTVVPGLINAHVHLKNFEQAEEAVRSGVLTLINMAGRDFPFQDGIRERGQAEPGLPYFLTAGNMVTVTDGHGTQYVQYETVDDAADIPGFVDRRVEEGSDFIKLTIERGDPWITRPTLSDDMVEATIEAAHGHSFIAVAHISEREDAMNAVRMGIDGLVHFWVKDFASNFAEPDASGMTDSELDLLRESATFIIPTITVWDKTNGQWQTIDMAAMKAEIGRVYEAGVPILAGTDPPGFGINFGSDLYTELLFLTECGLSDIDALRAATSNISIAFGLGNKGFVREGQSADLLLISGDSTEDIRTVENIAGVWKHGVRIE